MKTKIIICIVLILAIITGTVIANPQILYYNNIIFIFKISIALLQTVNIKC